MLPAFFSDNPSDSMLVYIVFGGKFIPGSVAERIELSNFKNLFVGKFRASVRLALKWMASKKRIFSFRVVFRVFAPSTFITFRKAFWMLRSKLLDTFAQVLLVLIGKLSATPDYALFLTRFVRHFPSNWIPITSRCNVGKSCAARFVFGNPKYLTLINNINGGFFNNDNVWLQVSFQQPLYPMRNMGVVDSVQVCIESFAWIGCLADITNFVCNWVKQCVNKTGSGRMGHELWLFLSAREPVSIGVLRPAICLQEGIIT